MGGKIDAYVDCVSPYSYYAALHLLRNRDVLKSYNVEVEFRPVFLGGIVEGSGNKPPWTLPAKSLYYKYDGQRAKKHFGVPNLKVPSFFPMPSLLPQRALTYIKHTQSISNFEKVFFHFWHCVWIDNSDISDPSNLFKALSSSELGLYNENQAQEIIEATKTSEIKQMLMDETKKALELGAFGNPWFWVRKSDDDQGEPFFGSDRFGYMWEYLGVPYNDVEIKKKEESKL